MTPVNMLPIRAYSRNHFVEVDKFETKKTEATSKVPIIPMFADFIDKNADKIFSNITLVKIDLAFESEMGQSLEAKVSFDKYKNEKVDITSEDIVHRGTFLLN